MPAIFSEAERGLLLEIERSPDDDAPRLVYADWLAEQDEPELAELVVVQCALAVSEPLDRERWRALTARQAALVREAEARWLVRLALPAHSCSLERGLPCRIVMRAADFVACDFRVPADVLLPELVLRLDPAGTEEGVRVQVQAALDSPNLDRVRRLDLSGAAWFVGQSRRQVCGDLLVRLLAASRRAEVLRGLALRACGLTDAGATALASALNLKGLTTLDLGGNELTGAGARALAESPSLRGLRMLDLVGNTVEEEAEAALGSAFGARLRLGSQYRPRRPARRR